MVIIMIHFKTKIILARFISFFATSSYEQYSISTYNFALCTDVAQPTINSSFFIFTPGETVLLTGYASPGNTITVTSSNDAVASIGSVVITDTGWQAPVTIKNTGGFTVTATASNCIPGSEPLSASAHYVVINPSGNDTLFKAIYTKYNQ